MFSQDITPQVKLWVVTLGILISLIIFAPPGFAVKPSHNNTLNDLVEKKEVSGEQGSFKSKVMDLLSVWSN